MYVIVTVDYAPASDSYNIVAFDPKSGVSYKLTLSSEEVGLWQPG